MSKQNDFSRLALAASDSPRAQEARERLSEQIDWVPMEEADAVVVLGGDGYMLHVLHSMINAGRIIPAYGLNLGTVGFLMNRTRKNMSLAARIAKAVPVTVSPLKIEATTQTGEKHSLCAINELSLLRETRQTAKIEVSVGDRVRIDELVCDGVLLATPVGSTAYNLSANGPILPLESNLLALTPISAFRPRRWNGAILPDRSKVRFRINEPAKRPVLAVADQTELRDIAEVSLEKADDTPLTLLFDPHHALDERIVAEQFEI